MSYERQREQDAIEENKRLKEMNDNINKRRDNVNHPAHYTAHPSGVECIQITEHMSFNLGNALKYIWRCDLKKDAIEDLKKARWYINKELEKRESEAKRVSDEPELPEPLQSKPRTDIWKEFSEEWNRQAMRAKLQSGTPYKL